MKSEQLVNFLSMKFIINSSNRPEQLVLLITH